MLKDFTLKASKRALKGIFLASALGFSLDQAVAQNVATWKGAVNRDFFNAANWVPVTFNPTAPNDWTVNIAPGDTVAPATTPNNPILVGPANGNTDSRRPAMFNVLPGGNFHLRTPFYAWASERINGTMLMDSIADFSVRNSNVWIGRKAGGTLTMRAGSFSTGNGGRSVIVGSDTAGVGTLNVEGGVFNVGGNGAPNLIVGDGPRSAGRVNISGTGVVNINGTGTLQIGNNGAYGRVLITGGGALRVPTAAGTVAALQAFIDQGRLVAGTNEVVSITADGTFTKVSATGGIVDVSRKFTWTGAISNDAFAPANYTPYNYETGVSFALNRRMGADGTFLTPGDTLLVPAGAANPFVQRGGLNSVGTNSQWRVARFNTEEGSESIIMGSFYTNGNDYLNGTVTVRNDPDPFEPRYAAVDVSIRNPAYIGSDGTGVLNVESGWFSTRNNLFVGQGSTGNGTLNVSGGTVNIPGTSTIGNGAGSVGTVNITAGEFRTTNLRLGHDEGTGVVNLSGGILRLLNTANVGITMNPTGRIHITGGTILLPALEASFTDAEAWIAAGNLTTTEGRTLDIDISEDGANVVVMVGGTPTATKGLVKSGATMKLYPNPTTSDAQIVLTGLANHGAAISIMDLSGRTVKSIQVAAQDVVNGEAAVRFEGAQLRAGIYLVRMVAGNSATTQRLVLTK